MKLTSKLLTTACALLASATLVSAQDNQGGGNRQGGGGRNFNPEEFRQRMAERMKESLKVSDEEWTALAPLVEKVTTKQRETMAGRFGGGRRGGGGGGGGDRGGSPEAEALRTALENESASPEDLKAKLTAVREARKKATEELTAAREELRKVLTVRQEAVLVSMGVLE